MKKSATTVKESILSKDMDAYKRLRRQGLQPPRIDGCDILEKQAVTKDEIQTGSVQPWVPEADRKKVAKERREAQLRAQEFLNG